jgi:GNAT superfamily N-acetyltransferase
VDSTYQIVSVEEPEEEAWGIIGRGVSRYNRERAGDNQFKRLCFVVRGPGEVIYGGILGETYWGWLYIDLLWVDERLRGRGFGRRLMETVEEAARQNGAAHAYLDTFSFQAPDFYRRLGYRVFGQLPDFPPGQQRYFMTKTL